MQSRSSTTPHLPSYFLFITSIQLFHHQSYRHTFPVPNEPSKSEVHQIPSHPVMICRIELPHYLFFVTVLDGSPIEFYLSVCCHVMAVFCCSVCSDIIATLLVLILTLMFLHQSQQFFEHAHSRLL